MSIVLKDVHQTLGSPPNHILKGISLEIQKKEFVALTGRSGSGKSTLLYIMSLLDKTSQGSVHYDNQNSFTFSREQLHHFRNENMGFVFQFHYLLPELSAIDNILMPVRKFHQIKDYQDRALELLDTFGLINQKDRLPRHLSGGEQQRIAIARSLILNPKYLFADEPTGNLDSYNGQKVMEIFQKINSTYETTIIYVTHDPGFASLASRQIHLVDGQIV